MIYFCSQKNRRALVLQSPNLNGIDYLEVSNGNEGCGAGLVITMLKDARSLGLGVAQVQVTGGTAKTQVTVLSVETGTNAAPKVVTVQLNHSGDFSTYTLALVANAATTDPPDGIDPQLSKVDFSFKAGCPTVADCLPCDCCPPDTTPEPDINYLAKDFSGFRQVMLDRMAVLAPAWAETHASDIGIALVELLAYTADHLSYQQDAVGTEAYLGTARSRISLRRLAKLVDYQIDEGSNARTWVYLKTAQDGSVVPSGTLLFPRVSGFLTTVEPNTPQAFTLLSSPLGFATMQATELYLEQNEILFYTWGDTDCCLANGATTATLMGNLTSLAPGAILVFEEVMGPDTGDPEDANPNNRWAVRLTAVQLTDHLNRPLVDPLNQQAITQISWAAEDALPFPLCISSVTDSEHGSTALFAVSVAWGNIVAADHGVWQPAQDLGVVPAAPPAAVTESSCECTCQGAPAAPLPRYYPELANSPVTFAWPLNNSGPASGFLAPASSSTSRAMPVILVQDDLGQAWVPLTDLLSSADTERAYVLEIEHDGSAFLRFGDGQYGMAPETGMDFYAQYRVGNGTAGNVGRDTLAHVLTNIQGISQVRNPLAAAGGVDPETMDHIRQPAPFAFRTQLRAVTEDDYGVMAELDPAINEARGTLRWTGSWYTAFVSVDTFAPSGPTAALLAATKKRLNMFRMMGVDLAVEGAVLVGLRIEMEICVDPGFFQADVHTALVKLFTTGNLCTGQPGMLDPENFTFGQTIYTSPFIAAAQGVEGVTSVTMTIFQRMDDPSIDGVALGYLTMNRLEIARCDNDPNRLDLGIFVLHMDGGK